MRSAAVVDRLRVAGIIAILVVASASVVQTVMWLAVGTEAGRTPEILSFASTLIAVAVTVFAYAFVLRPAYRRCSDELSANDQRFDSIFQRHPDAALVFGPDRSIRRVNVAMERLTGRTQDELLGSKLEDYVTPKCAVYLHEALRGVFDGEGLEVDSELLCRDGSLKYIGVQLVPVCDRDGFQAGLAFVKDVSRPHAAEKRERSHRDRLRAVSMLASAHAHNVASQIVRTLEFGAQSLGLDAANVGIVRDGLLTIVHGAGDAYENGAEIDLGRSFVRHVFGSRDVMAIDDSSVEPWRDDPANEWQQWQCFLGATVFVGGVAEGIVSFAASTRRPKPFDDADLDFVRVIASLIGASIERERQEHQLSEMAFVDSLTRLPNRLNFFEQLSGAIARARRTGESLSVHYVDLDGFKAVNDTMGHGAGDEVLETIAERLRKAVREGDVLARVGGDEFVVLQSNCDDDESAVELGLRLVDAASIPIVVRDQVLRLGASVGIARFPRDADGPDELVRRADQAMYRAKNDGKNRTVLFEPSIGPIA